MRAYQQDLHRIRERCGELIAISPQLPDRSLSTQEQNELEFAVLSDVGNRVARAYGLVFAMPERMIDAQRLLGTELPEWNGDDAWELPIPGTFVLGRDGVVRLAYVDPDYRNRLEPDEILSVLD